MDHLNQKLTFTLTVTDNKGATSTDSVDILVAEDPSLEHIHINLAQPLSNIKPGNTFVIDGSKSKGNIISWSITQNEGPTVQLSNSPLRFSKQFIMPSARVGFTLTVKSITETQSSSIIVNPDNDTTTPSTSFKFESKIGSQGTGNGQFVDPHDVAIDSDGNLFVCDPGRQDIQKLTPTGAFILKFGSAGTGTNQFKFPYGINIGSDGDILIADSQGHKIHKFSNTGVHKKTITTIPQANPNVMDSPEAIAIDPVNGDIYVCDARKNRILKFDKDLNYILSWGSLGTGDNQFNHPHGISVDSNRNVYVVQSGVATVKVYTKEGQFIKKWGSQGTTDGTLLPPLEHSDIDQFDRLFIVNNDQRPLIQVFDKDGKYITKFGSDVPGSGDGQFMEPENSRRKTGKVYVVDRENQRIQVFAPEGSTPPPPPPPDDVDAKFPELLAKAKPGTTFVLDGSQSSGSITSWNIIQVEGPTVQLVDNPKKYSKQFIMPNEKVKFTLTVNSPTKSNSDTITVNPDNDTTEPTGKVLWDSNIHMKVDKITTVKGTFGDQKIDGKGFYTAASGSPRCILYPDGKFELEADSGHGRIYVKAKNYNARLEGELMFVDSNLDNTTWKLRNRHGMGGDCQNRFGGVGGVLERGTAGSGAVETKIEKCHNEHESGQSGNLPKAVNAGQWIGFKYSVFDTPSKDGIVQQLEIDYKDGQGFKKVLDATFKNPPAYYVDKNKFMENSEFWIRINNSKTGKVAYKNVRLIEI
jgi:DNA-binding beta-propeller fold protein YncE